MQSFVVVIALLIANGRESTEARYCDRQIFVTNILYMFILLELISCLQGITPDTCVSKIKGLVNTDKYDNKLIKICY